MKRLFWRLTMMFWVLFCIVVLLFGLTFYLNYEKNYSQQLLEIDRNVTTIGKTIDDIFRGYIQLANSQESTFLSIFEENLDLLHSLSSDEINTLLAESKLDSQGLNQENSIFSLAFFKSKETVAEIFPRVKQLYQEDYRLLDFEFISLYDTNRNQSILDEEEKFSQMLEIGDQLYLVNEENYQDDTNGNSILAIYKFIDYQDNSLGYIRMVWERLDVSELVFGNEKFENALYYIGENNYNKNFSSHGLEQNLSQASFEEASQFLKNEGYYINRYISDRSNLKIVYYELKSDLERSILRQTISLFELSTILLIILFLLVSYILFVAIIKPCYLLIDYVRRCGEGEYTIPSDLSATWRSSFIKVRNAYLENERLLNVKDNQSQELEYAWKRALVASQAKTLFLAKVSHELKTPLNAIKGYVQLLKLSIEQPRQRKQLDIIEHSSGLLLKQVNELLDFSMVEDGKIKLSIEKFDIFQTARKVEELLIIDAMNKGINFTVTIDERIPHELYGDEGRIKQIIINLVSNAIKFTESGEIRVILDLDYQNETDAYLSIKVKDTGKGIAPQKLESIFEAFTQENDTISRRFGGTGLGLSISKRLAEIMGGKLTVESIVDVGSTFTLFLPLSRHLVEEDES